MKKVSKLNKYTAECATYLFNALYDREANFATARENLKDEDFDTIVCIGVSGVVFAAPLALQMKKNLMVVRKSQRGTHSHKLIEANCTEEQIGKWIFVDDLVDTGKTFKKVKKAMERFFGESATYVGKYLYDNHDFEVDI